MSSLRNAAPRRNHKERAQPGSRAKWGILEKHKDYSLRAQDYNLKKRKLSQLEAKARERNPDEFAFGMLSADKARQGKHGQGETEARLSHDAVKLLKSQDAGYLRVVAGRGRREVERLEEGVKLAQLIAAGPLDEVKGHKIVFVESDEGLEARGETRRMSGQALGEVEGARPNSVSAEEQEQDTHVDAEISDGDEKTATTTARQTKKVVEKVRKAKLDLQAERKRRRRLAEMRANKLEALKKRQREIMAATNALELQRAKMARSVGGVNKNGVKFKIRERRR